MQGRVYVLSVGVVRRGELMESTHGLEGAKIIKTARRNVPPKFVAQDARPWTLRPSLQVVAGLFSFKSANP
jgi:hypothetical protein